MSDESLKNKTIKGTFWSSIERFSVQAIQFIVMIFMARILTPADYGIVGMIAIFIAVSQSLIDSGFSQALIRKSNRSQVDNSTVFYFNIVIGCCLYLILFFCAKPISIFYDEPILIPVTRLVAISIPVNSFAVVQRAILTGNVDFKTQAKASFVGALCSGVIGLSLAYTGYGVWAIVWTQITSTIVNVSFLWCLAKWRPTWQYSWKSFKTLFHFGSKLLASGILNTVYNNVYLIVIGKIFKASDLGYYTRANQFSQLSAENITGILQRVTFPILCKIQDDDKRLGDIYRKILRTSAFVIFPIMTGMAGVAKPLVLSILTEKWLYSSVLLVPICLTGMWFPIHAINLNLLQVKGRSDLFFKLEIWKKVIGVIILIVTIPFGLYWMCWGLVFSTLLCLILNTHYTGLLINLGFIQQMKDLLPILILSLAMGVASWSVVTFIPMPSGGALAAGVGTGILVYFFGSKIFRFKEFSEIMVIIKRK